jgi:hypothetical protein
VNLEREQRPTRLPQACALERAQQGVCRARMAHTQLSKARARVFRDGGKEER